MPLCDLSIRVYPIPPATAGPGLVPALRVRDRNCVLGQPSVTHNVVTFENQTPVRRKRSIRTLIHSTPF